MKYATVIGGRYGGQVQRWLFLLLAMLSFISAAPVQAARINNGIGVPGPTALFAPSPVPPQFDITGFIQDATVAAVGSMCPTVTDPRLMGGTVTLNGQKITVPCNTVLQMPAFATTWADLFTLAPQDITPVGKSGLALADPLAPGMLGAPVDAAAGLLNHLPTGVTFRPANASLPSHEIHVVGNIINGQYIAGLIFISQQSLNSGSGIISCIDYATGEIQVGGTVVTALGAACPAPAPGVARVRMNDPVGRFGIVHGGPNSVGADVIEPGYDPRYTADTDNPTMHSALGFPICIPRANPVNAIVDPITGAPITAGTDPLCPMYNRPVVPNCKSFDPLTGIVPFGAQTAGYCTTWVMDAPGAHAANPSATDPTVAAPLVPGDTITFSGTLKADASGAQYISAHTIGANLGIYTLPHTQPSYIFMEGVLVGAGGATVGGLAAEATTRLMWIGFASDPTELVDFFAIHQDPVTGASSEFHIGTQDPCCSPLGRFRTPVNNVGAFGTPQRNYRAVSRTACQPPGVHAATTLAITSICHMDPLNSPVVGAAAQASVTPNSNGLIPNQYTLPNFEFIFGENLSFGAPLVPNNFQDLPFLFCGSGPVNGPGSGTTVIGQLNPAPWALPMPDPVFASTLCPTALKVGGAPVVVGPTAPQPAVINSVTATPASTLVGSLTRVTLVVSATNPQGGALSYAWTAPAGVIMSCGTAVAPNVCLAATNANTTVTGTFTPTAVGTLAFTVTVANGVLPNTTATASVVVASNTAKAPTLKSFSATPAGPSAGQLVTLTAIGNTNPATGNVSFSFKQTGGPAVTISAITITGTGTADRTARATFIAPTVPTKTSLTFQATVKDITTGLTTTGGATQASVTVAATPPDTVTFICPGCGIAGGQVLYQAIGNVGGVTAQRGKLTVSVTSSATPAQVGGTMTATFFNNTLAANVPGSSALPLTMTLLAQPADPVGTLPGASICGPTVCWTNVAPAVIDNLQGTLLPPTTVTVTSPLGGRATVSGASATGPIVIQ